jgi:hypothetical protein
METGDIEEIAISKFKSKGDIVSTVADKADREALKS